MPQIVFLREPANGQGADGRVSCQLPDLLPRVVELAAGGGDVALEPGEVR